MIYLIVLFLASFLVGLNPTDLPWFYNVPMEAVLLACFLAQLNDLKYVPPRKRLYQTMTGRLVE